MQTMKLIFSFFLLIPICIFTPDADAHPLFNSGEEWIGDYRIQIATLPEIPAVDEKIQVLLRVVDADFQELENFTLGIRIFYDGEQVDAVMPTIYQSGHVEMDYIFENSGNHVLGLICTILPRMEEHSLTLSILVPKIHLVYFH